MARAKWFRSLAASTPSHRAASVVLRARVRAVRHFLRLLSMGNQRDPEDVHQLRVATRRLAAAIAAFRPSFDWHRSQPLRRATRRLRRAAGAVRDLHVLHQVLDSITAASSKRDGDAALIVARSSSDRKTSGGIYPRRDKLGGALWSYLETEHRAAERALHRALPVSRHRFEAAAVVVLHELSHAGKSKAASDTTLVEIARPFLRERLRRFAAAGRADLDDLIRLHEFRVAAKRLRYGMELFDRCFPATFRDELYPQVSEIQRELGDINDLRNLRDRLTGAAARRSTAWLDRGREAAARGRRLRVVISQRLLMQQRAFLRTWPPRRRIAFRRRFIEIIAASEPASSVGESPLSSRYNPPALGSPVQGGRQRRRQPLFEPESEQ